ncbi:MAG: hypothetical protein K2X26_05795 [Chitinophagaceae bacterium]|nr:hypothetical protein [Chitinophagaceae bacterium]
MEIFPNELTPSTNTETITQNQQTENMEVHKHPHHVTHKKKWTEYLLEFLMLFLAVFLGFFAENVREHKVEKEREKQFVTSLINDLRLDMNWLDTVNNSIKLKIQNIDSALELLTTTKNNEMPVKAYLQLQRAQVQIMFFSNNGTITQLKSSGGMRLISKRDVVDSIEGYDRLMRRLEVRRDRSNQLNDEFSVALNKAAIGKDLFSSLYDSVLFKKPVIKQTIGLNTQFANELINTSLSLRLRAISDTKANSQTKEDAGRLIQFIKKEYHLE